MRERPAEYFKFLETVEGRIQAGASFGGRGFRAVGGRFGNGSSILAAERPHSVMCELDQCIGQTSLHDKAHEALSQGRLTGVPPTLPGRGKSSDSEKVIQGGYCSDTCLQNPEPQNS